MAQPMCFVSIEKVNSLTQMNNKYRHNMRLKAVDNADPEKRAQNEVLIGDDSIQDIFNVSIEDANQLNEKHQYKKYTDLAKEQIDEVQKQSGRKVRKDAVLGIEVVCTFPAEAVGEVDVEEWKKANIEWLKEYFGEENVVSAVLHNDEVVPHIHAMVLPVDREKEKPSFNSKKWIGGKSTMISLQDSYAEQMKPLGLVRGVRGSFARHKEIQAYYSALNNVIQNHLPEKEVGESDLHYYARIDKLREERELRILKLEQTIATLEKRDQTNAFYRKIAEEKVEELEIKMRAAEKKVKYLDDLMEAMKADKQHGPLAQQLDAMVQEQRRKKELEKEKGREKGKEKEKLIEPEDS